MEQTEKFDSWGIAEVMGHKKFAGRITEQTIAGAALVRVDVPSVTTRRGDTVPEYSKLFGVASIYCITPTSEEVARTLATAFANNLDSQPLPYHVAAFQQIPARTGASDDADDADWEPAGFDRDDEEPG
jgi:hypothetical protein